MEKLKGRVAVVTGGANGIGFGLARRFVEEGMKVVICDVNVEELNRAVSALTDAGGEVLGQRTDVSDAAQVQALADTAVAHFGAVHVLCNNAGVGGYQRFTSLTAESWQWQMGVNLWGPIHGCRIFLPILAAQDEAHIVNTSSMAGFIYPPYHQPYAVTRAGVVALSESLYREFELEKPHIGVSVLCPAFVKTRIADFERNAPPGHVHCSDSDPDLESFRDQVRAGLSTGKEPSEVADLVVQAMRERQLHIFTHPEWLGVIRARAEDIVAGKPVRDYFAEGDDGASLIKGK